MTIAIICPDRDPAPWYQALKAVDPAINIQLWPNENNKENINFILCWNQPEDIWQNYPNLQCICSMGAGVDHLFDHQDLPQRVPIVRIVDTALTRSMFEYICASVMYYHRQLDIYKSQQQAALWRVHDSKMMAETRVGIMGLGVLGAYTANKLAEMGFSVSGWSRTKKSMDNINTYAGDAELTTFAEQVDFLVCLLPLTEQTSGILNFELFSKLKPGSCLINVARGEHLVENDLLDALDEGMLRGACIDVFHQEPLPPTHPFWGDDRILLTPHCSSITEPLSAAPQIIENYRRLQKQQPLLNQVDRQRGY